MATKNSSDETLFKVNEALYNALSSYVDDGVDIRFDLPDTGSPPITPTISVFLYDIHEDLQLKSAESRAYYDGKLQPGRMNVCCHYLITFWDKAATEGSPNGGPKNQAALVMNQVLNALINSRQLSEIPNAFTRVMPPREGLNSFGNFWQSLGNRPRLVLNYSVTVPIFLTDKNQEIPQVDNMYADVERQPQKY